MNDFNAFTIIEPPQLAPFVFPTNVEEGSNIQATCSVMSGDRPIYFSWLKDSLPIPSSLEVKIYVIHVYSIQQYVFIYI